MASEPNVRDLNGIRNEIAAIDEEIVRLCFARLRLAREAGRIKHTQGLPIVNKVVERLVRARTVSLARRLGLEESLARKIVELLIEHAVAAQKNMESV